MTKEIFIKQLNKKLRSLPANERNDVIKFYSELIRDSIESGRSEEEVLASLGDIDEIAAKIISESPSSANKKPLSTPLRVLITIALILGSPVWLGVLCALFGCVISVVAVLLSAIAALFAICLALATMFIAGIVSFFFIIPSNTLGGLFQLGSGLVSLGLAFLLFLSLRAATHGILIAIKKVVTAPWNYFKNRKGGNYNV